MLTATLIKRFAPKARADIVRGLVDGWPAIDGAGINTPRRLQHFMAQIYHESARFQTTREIWGPTPAQKRYEGRADLGNTQSGDGSRFRGRGLIQTTGRANYREATVEIRKLHPGAPDFEENPELLEQFPWALLGALVFWTKRNLNAIADRDSIVALTKRINGGTNGLADRKAALARARTVFVEGEPAARATKAAKPTVIPVPVARPSKTLLLTYQQRLKDLGFYGLRVDGKWRDGTSGAIGAFKHANGLSGENTFDAEMVALLMSDGAKGRTVAEERASATASDIRAEAPIVRKAERSETAAVVQAAVPAAGGLAWYASQAVEYLEPVREFLSDVPVGVWVAGVVALSLYLWWQSRQIKDARVAMHRAAEVG